jgi:hypothetical protein
MVGPIFKLQNLRYARPNWESMNRLGAWNRLDVTNIDLLNERMLAISIIKTTLDYQERIHSDPANNRSITVDTDAGCLTGTIDFPSNIYTLEIPVPVAPVISITPGTGTAADNIRLRERQVFAAARNAHGIALQAYIAAFGASTNVNYLAVLANYIDPSTTAKFNNPIVPVVFPAGEIGYYDAGDRNIRFVKINFTDTGDPKKMKFNDPECPYVETRLATRAVKQAGGSYYKKYLKYKNKYINQILLDNE